MHVINTAWSLISFVILLFSCDIQSELNISEETIRAVFITINSIVLVNFIALWIADVRQQRLNSANACEIIRNYEIVSNCENLKSSNEEKPTYDELEMLNIKNIN